MYDLMSSARLIDLERRAGSGLPPGEDYGETMHRFRLERERDSQLVPESCRQWWLDEQGWLLERRIDGGQAVSSLADYLLIAIADRLAAASTWLRRRSKSVGQLQPQA